MTRRSLRILTVVFGVVAVGLGLWRLQIRKSRGVVPPADYGAVKEFSLIERSGKKVTLADLHGRPWIANFIFTRCMGPCPLMTRRMKELEKEYMARTNIQFVSFSVDPEYDRPEVLTKFAETYKADPERWYFLTGTRPEINRLVLESFHLAIEQYGGEINHSLHFVLVDKDGRVRGYYNGSEPPELERLRADIKKIVP